MGRKKLVRKAEPPSKRGIAWPRWTGFRGMTVRNWLELLIVPLALVVIGLLFTMLQDARQQQIENQRAQQAQKIENQRAQQAQKIENKRAEAERELAEQRAQDEALQAYLDQMSQLMLERKLLEAEGGDPVYTLAQARTSTVLARLDAAHNRSVARFLVDSGLASSLLRDIALEGADLRDADLIQADLTDAELNDADLSGASLIGTDLSGAILKNTDLNDADLNSADLNNTFVRNADLSGAGLFEANLSSAFLVEVNLSGANLRGADLSDVILGNANLSGAEGITNEELEQQATSLQGAIMPNGQKYEEWLKDPGQLHTTMFEPALSYDISDGWKLTTETTDELFLEGPERGELTFATPTRVFDPSSPSDPTKVSAPENVDEWASWFQRHPNLDASEPVSVSVGGAAGMRIDVTLSSPPENYSRGLCGEQSCVPLYPLGGKNGIVVYEGYKDRFIILDVGDETVLIDAAVTTDKFEAFLPKAQKMLDTVEWKSP